MMLSDIIPYLLYPYVIWM